MKFYALEPTYGVSNSAVKFAIAFDCIVQQVGVSTTEYDNKLNYDIQPFI